MTEIVFVSDFFINEVNGGAEHYNDVLISLLKDKHIVTPVKSNEVTINFLNSKKHAFFIVANFFQLSYKATNKLIGEFDYAILEHDHKYSKTNNPSRFVNFFIPETHVINREFFRNARAILCQSKIHSEVVQKNLFLNNVCNLGGNLWSEYQLSVLEKNMHNEKTVDHGIMWTMNKNKGAPFAVEYCKKNNLSYKLLHNKKFEEFVKELSQVRKLVFFPQWLESYCRVVIEAKILGCKLISNGLLGVASEDYFKQSGQELLDTIRSNNKMLYNKWISVIENNNIEYVNPIQIPKITILGTFYNGDKHIKGFLENITSQTIFDRCELILIDANSPGNEKQIIDEYTEKYDNIIYKRLDYRATTGESFNLGIEMSTGEFLTLGLIDDRRRKDGLEMLAKHLMFTPSVDLVYGDCFETAIANETFEKNSSKGKLYEHSIKPFSKENMIKCLPGPMPLWRRSMNEKHGMFDVTFDFADDWELWLRSVDAGSKFKKVNKPVGLYLKGGRSQSDKLNIKQKLEESDLFFKYSHLFGKNYKLFKDYFTQLRRLKDVK